MAFRLGVSGKIEQEVGCLAGHGSGAKDGAVIAAQHFKPAADIVGVTDGRLDG